MCVTSTLRYVLCTGNALSFRAGTGFAGELAHSVLVSTRRTLDALLLLPTVEGPHATAHWRRQNRSPLAETLASSFICTRTTLSILKDLSSAAGLHALGTFGGLLSHLVLCPRELDVKLLFVDGLPEGPHGALQLLLHLLAHAVHVTGV